MKIHICKFKLLDFRAYQNCYRKLKIILKVPVAIRLKSFICIFVDEALARRLQKEENTTTAPAIGRGSKKGVTQPLGTFVKEKSHVGVHRQQPVASLKDIIKEEEETQRMKHSNNEVCLYCGLVQRQKSVFQLYSA